MLLRNIFKLSLILLGIGLLVSLFALPGGALPGSAEGQAPPAQGAQDSGGELLAAAADIPPTTQSVDDDGYITWSVDYSSIAWCVPVSTLRYPLDLGAQDPTELSDAVLTLNYVQRNYIVSQAAKDASWSVAWNGKPPDNWQRVGNIKGVISPPEGPILNTQTITITNKLLQDGENNVWLEQHEVCPTAGCETCACTCVELTGISLRAAPRFKVKIVSPKDLSRNVPFDQGEEHDIRVQFTRPPDPDSLSIDTVELRYYDESMDLVTVSGDIEEISPLEYAFVPDEPLLDGVMYEVEVWGKKDAEAADRSEWVKSETGEPLESSTVWSFWTAPDLQVEVVPVQVLDQAPLIVNKPTALKVFMRWEKKDDVAAVYQLDKVQVDDIVVSWTAVNGSQSGSANWKSGWLWQPTQTAASAMRKREYREFDQYTNSYNKFEKLASQDSVNFFGFMPLDTGIYEFNVEAILLDHQGRPMSFTFTKGLVAELSRQYKVYVKAAAVGSNYGATGSTNLSASIDDAFSALKAIYPVPSVSRPANASAIPWYKPTTSLWVFNWATEPAWRFPKLYLMQEMSALCLKSSGCDAMVGFTPQTWLTDLGISRRESAPNGVLVQMDNTEHYRFVVAHEVGHLEGFDEHSTVPGGEGFWVQGASKDKDRRDSVAILEPVTQKTRNVIHNFMTIDPVESPPPEALWIAESYYSALRGSIQPGAGAQAATGDLLNFTPQPERVSDDALLLASGGIREPSGEVETLPWYLLDPGDYPEPVSGPYKIMFLDSAGQELASYTRAFTTTGTEDPAEPGLFTFKIPYPPNTARIQIRRVAGNDLLKEIVPSATPPGLSLDPPASTIWQGEHAITWQTSGAGPRYYSVDVSTDNGATWEALAVHLTEMSYGLDTAAFPNTSTAWVRIMASDGLRTTTVSGGPYTFDNPPQRSYVSPAPGAVDVGVQAWITAGFRDDMDPASLNGQTFTLAGGPFGSVSGEVVYDAGAREAVFHPSVPLSYATVYTATLTTAIRDISGEHLPAEVRWSFTTAARDLPPEPVAYSPAQGARGVPLNAVVSAIWDAPLDPAAVDPAAFALSPLGGSPLSGVVGYNPASNTLTFTPASDLLPNQAYMATIAAGIADLDGNLTLGEIRWVFSTGDQPSGGLAFTGSFTDAGRDDDGDGLYEHLLVRVGVQVDDAGSYRLAGRLVDKLGEEIGGAAVQADLPGGMSFVELLFPGAQIGGHGVDGPYTLTGLTLYLDGVPGGAAVLQQAHRTAAYLAAQFDTPLHFSALPDLRLTPGEALLPAFNVRSYAQHTNLSPDQLGYLIVGNSELGAGVTLESDGSLTVSPQAGWEGAGTVTVEASDGQVAVQDTFRVTVGWPSQVYLPAITSSSYGSSQSARRDYWRTALKENYDDMDAPYPSWSYGWGVMSQFPDYFWRPRDCAAYSGQYSNWAFGSHNSAEDPPPCGADYMPSGRGTIVTMPEHDPYHNKTVNLEFASAAELRMKVLTNLEEDDQVCALVAKDSQYKLEEFFGACHSGQTNGWEDLVLDLANVPTLGSLLGYKDLRVALDFRSTGSGSRPYGAYVDDLQLRVCLRGLPCSPANSPAPPLVTGSVGGYKIPEYDGVQTALGVESSGRIHVLWTGELSYFDEDYSRRKFVFYSTSTDGVHWTPALAINDNGSTPALLVDNTRHIVHLVYEGLDGLVHHTVTDGVVSEPTIITSSGGSPKVALDPATGYLHILWLDGYLFNTGIGSEYRARTVYAYWDGSDWSAPLRPINNPDTGHSSLAVAPGEGVMLAWFQDWQAGFGGGIGADDPRQVRTAYGPGLGEFPLRQAASGYYPVPENDEEILLTYSGVDGKFYMVTDHFMWPTHSRVYRYTWEGGVWSEPVDVSGNTEQYATPWYVGAASSQAKVVYYYKQNWANMLRVETDGVLGAPEDLDTYLSGLGYAGVYAVFVDEAGEVHLLVGKSGDSGIYYLQR